MGQGDCRFLGVSSWDKWFLANLPVTSSAWELGHLPVSPKFTIRRADQTHSLATSGKRNILQVIPPFTRRERYLKDVFEMVPKGGLEPPCG